MIDRPDRISPAPPPWRVRQRDPDREQPPRREPQRQPEHDEAEEDDTGHIDVRA